MRRLLITLAAAVAAMTGCADERSTPPNPASSAGLPPPTSPPGLPPPASPAGLPPPAALAGLPPPAALADVLYRLADPSVPGAQKLTLVQDAHAADATALDGFAAALRDGGFTPLTVAASDIRWSDGGSGDVLATVGLTGPGQRVEAIDPFVFPMEFRRGREGWQLTRETAAMVLVLPDTGAGAPGTATPP